MQMDLRALMMAMAMKLEIKQFKHLPENFKI
jgi:hypothetical protein